MSEFYFDYKCISLDPNFKSTEDEHDLKFFLFQDYKNGDMYVQVAVSKEFQNAKPYERVKVFQCEHGIDYMELMQDKYLSDSYPMHGSSDAVDQENGFKISPQEGRNLSSVGIIAFIREGQDVAEIEDCFKYAINYSKREVISYRILEKKKKMIVEIRYPRLLKDIDLCIIRKSNCKPLLMGDKNNANNVISKGNEPRIITLKAMGNEFTWLKEVIDTPSGFTFTNDCRLFFMDDKDNEFYMLDDEGDFVIEDQKEREKVIARKRNAHYKHVGVIKCPYCNSLLPDNVKKAKQGIFSCQGKIIDPLNGIPGIGNGKKAIICGKNLKEESNNIIKVNNLILPDKSDKIPTLNIAVAGFTKCGKTVYLASVINMLATNVTAGRKTYNASPFILENVVEHFSRKFAKNKSVEMVQMLALGKKKDDSLFVDKTQEESRAEVTDGLNIMERYNIKVNQEIENHTFSSHADILSWNPIGFRMGELGYLYFYDVPGERFMDKDKQPLRTFSIADGIIAIIDGEKLSAARGAGKGKKKTTDSESVNPITNLNDTLKAITDLAGHRDLTDVPIAIVFTKLDLKIKQYVESTEASVIEKCFDDNCHILREDMISLFPKNRRYRGSELERHIDCASYELQHFLKNLTSEEERNVYEQILKKYHNIKFFACSSVGSDSVFESKEGESRSSVIRRPRRLRIELPLIWLMHKNGMVRD